MELSARGQCETYVMDIKTQRIRPYEGTDPYLFISYAHRDYDRIEPILRELAARGYRFWYDEGIDPGTEWPESIARHLENSSACLSFITPHSAASNNCRREIHFALSRNIPLLTVYLEETKISSGLEMQLSSNQSVMAYRYPDLGSLMERILSVDVMDACRGTPDAAVTGEGGTERKAAGTRRKRALLPVIAAVLVLAAAAAILLWPKIKTEPAESEVVTPVSPSARSAEPGTAEATATPRTAAPSKPVATPGPLPEGYSVLLRGKWEDGAVLASANGDKTVRIELTDDRIPYGYPMSDTPGKNAPVWNVVITFGEGKSMNFDIKGITGTYQFTFRDLHTSKGITLWTSRRDLGGFRYNLIGNTFCYETVLPEELTVQEIDSVNVFLGTETDRQREYYFFLDEPQGNTGDGSLCSAHREPSPVLPCVLTSSLFCF